MSTKNAVIAAVIVGFGLPYITAPSRQNEEGTAPPPADSTDARVLGEAAAYRSELGPEVVKE